MVAETFGLSIAVGVSEENNGEQSVHMLVTIRYSVGFVSVLDRN